MRTGIPHLAPVALAIAITVTTGCGSTPGGAVASGAGVAAKKAPLRPGQAVKRSVAQPVAPVSRTGFYD